MKSNMDFRSFCDVLAYWAEVKKHDEAIVFEGINCIKSITYGQLNSKALSFAAKLQSLQLSEQRVLLIYDQGLEFIIAFFGCLYAGVTAIPVYKPQGKAAQWEKLIPIMEDADLAAIIGEQDYVAKMGPWLDSQASLLNVSIISHETCVGFSIEGFKAPRLSIDSEAFFQYTSGSTGNPKGVMISHGNMLDNTKSIQKAMHTDINTVAVSWLPLYHDAGMVGMLLHMLYVGGKLVLFTPTAFVQRPVLWFDLITKYKACFTGSPNFAFDICVNRISEEQMASIDLSSLKVAFNGAEPVDFSTIELFSEKFASVGFQKSAFVPCYGLAESTLFVSGDSFGKNPETYAVDYESLGNGVISAPVPDQKSKTFVSCGSVDCNNIVIVDPETKEVLSSLQNGEVWLRSGSVSKGYFRKSIETQESFHAKTSENEGPYYRTGDLGFVCDGELYISGRINDLIIVNGKNHYPQDIERTIRESVESIAADGIGVVPDDLYSSKGVFVIAEVQRKYLRKINVDEVLQDITSIVFKQHQLKVSGIALINPVTIPKTTSGKVKRKACRQAYVAQSLKYIKSFDPTLYCIALDEVKNTSQTVDTQHAYDIIADELQLTSDRLNVSRTLMSYGLDSIRAISIASRLSHNFNTQLHISALFSNQSISDLCGQLMLASQQEQSAHRYHLPEEHSQPFVLTDMQAAYVAGRTNAYKLGGVSLQAYFEFEGDIDLPQFEKAWNKTINKHDMLRATLNSAGMQVIANSVPYYPIEVTHLTELKPEEQSAVLAETRQRKSEHTFPLEVWPVFEVTATTLSKSKTRLHMLLDGIFIDATSFQIIIDDLVGFYLDDQYSSLIATLSFQQYVDSIVLNKSSNNYKRSLAHWTDKAASIFPAPKLSLNHGITQNTHPGFSRIEHTVKKELWEAIQAQCATNNVTSAATLLTCFALVVATWSESQQFSLNIPVQNRTAPIDGIEQIVGHLSSFSLTEFDLTNELTFQENTVNTQKQLLDCVEYGAVSGMEIVELIKRHSVTNIDNAFPVVFTNLLSQRYELDNAPLVKFERHIGKQKYGLSHTPQVWLDCQVNYCSDGIKLNWDFVNGLFSPDMIDDMFSAFVSLIEHLSTEPSFWQTKMGSLIPSKQIDLLNQVNGTQSDYSEGTLHSLFEKQCYSENNTIAMVNEDLEISFSQLEHWSNQVAHWLVQKGVKSGDFVAIATKKCWQQIVFALGVSKSGGAYVPIDPKMPLNRAKDIATQTSLKYALVTELSTLEPVFAESGVNVLAFGSAEMKSKPKERVQIDVDADSIAYVLFTSGSTGTPKGVVISHKAALNTIVAMNEKYKVTNEDSVLGLSSLSFDLSVYDIFGVMGVGGTLVLPNSEDILEPAKWLSLITKTKVTIWNTVPAMMSMLCAHSESSGQAVPSLRQVFLSGDWLPTTLIPQIFKQCPNTAIANLGGATEASIWSNYHDVDKEKQNEYEFIPYGKPLANQSFHILNAQMQPVPFGVIGDLYISGIGLANEYLGDKAKTDASFIFDQKLQKRLYRTGDLGRYLYNGEIEFIGRKDKQIKIDGHRIELGEIESVAEKLTGLEQAIAVVNGDTSQKSVALYVKPKRPKYLHSPSNTSIDAMSQHLAFKFEHQGIRNLGDERLSLAGKPTVEINKAEFLKRQSFREYKSRPINGKSFGEMLACLSALDLGDGLPAKRRYPSPGSLYPVQVYLAIRPNSIEGVSGGYYYYDPIAHDLLLLAPSDAIELDLLYPNEVQNICVNSAFNIFMIADLSEIKSNYGPLSEEFCYLEAGYLSQLLMENAPAHQLGACPLGRVNVEQLKPVLQLTEEHKYIHALAFGAIESDQVNRRDLVEQSKNGLVTVDKLKQHLSQYLPSHMIPRYIKFVDEFPLTANGKIDLKNLPAINKTQAVVEEIRLPESNLQQMLADLLKELLDVEQVPINVSFIELGANSITISQFIARVNKELNASISVAKIFEFNSIESLTSYIQSTGIYMPVKAECEVELEEGEI